MIIFRGKAQWTDNTATADNHHPIRNAPIQLWEDDPSFSGDDLLAEAVTDSEGNYEFQVPLSVLTSDLGGLGGAPELFILINAETPTSANYSFVVRDNLITSSNTKPPVFQAPFDLPDLTPFLQDPASFDNIVNIDDLIIPYQSGGNIVRDNQAFSIFDAINVGYDYYEIVDTVNSSNQPPLLDILFPSTNYTFYSPPQRELSIVNGDWIDWDVILHEFGHYISDLNQLDQSPPYSHTAGVSNINNVITLSNGNLYTVSKLEGVRLAWGEGLATYLSLAAQHVVHNQGRLPSNIPNVNNLSIDGSPDTVYSDTIDASLSLDLESNLASISPFFPLVDPFIPQGEGDEAAVYRILWDLADGVNEPHDEVEVIFSTISDQLVGHEALYRILDQAIPVGTLDQLEDIWNFFSTNTQYLGFSDELSEEQRITKLGAIFEEYNVSPRPNSLWFSPDYEPFIPSISGNSPPREFQWQLGNHGANDEFEIMIFDGDYNRVFEYTLDPQNQSEWNISDNQMGTWTPELGVQYGSWTWEQLVRTPDTYHVVIAGRDTTEVATGTYWSGAHSFQVETIVTTNTPPVVRDIDKSSVESANFVFEISDFENKFIDPDGDLLTQIQITSLPLPEEGILQLGTESITINQEISRSSLDEITFVPANNFNGLVRFGWNGNDGFVYANSAADINLFIAPVNDQDDDGISDAVEQLIGDKNLDGILDYQQANVASFRPPTVISTNPDDFITIASSDGTSLSKVSVTNTLPQNAPQDVDFPVGMINFTIEGVMVGGATQVSLLLPEGVVTDTYWKYSHQSWDEFLYDGSTGAEFFDSDGDGESDRILLHFIDGGRGDADGLANGVIVDPGAPVIQQSIPTPNPTPNPSPSPTPTPNPVPTPNPTPVPIPDLQFGDSIADRISTDSEVDSFTFAATEGDRVFLRMTEETGSSILEPELTLLAPDGTQLSTSFGNRSAFLDSLLLNETGIYTLLASDRLNDDIGDYSITIQSLDNPTILDLSSGNSANGAINPASDIDGYRFTGNVGDRIFIRMSEIQGSTSLVPEIRLFGPDGTQIAEDTHPRSAFINGFRLNTTGSYTILTSDFGGDAAGGYNLTLQSLENVSVVPIVVGDTIEDSIDVGSDLDVYRFAATAGDQITIQMTEAAGSSTLFPEFQLLSPDGSQLRSVTHASNAELTDFILSETGVYTIIAGDRGGDRVGGYTLSLQGNGDPITLPPPTSPPPTTDAPPTIAALPDISLSAPDSSVVIDLGSVFTDADNDDDEITLNLTIESDGNQLNLPVSDGTQSNICSHPLCWSLDGTQLTVSYPDIDPGTDVGTDTGTDVAGPQATLTLTATSNGQSATTSFNVFFEPVVESIPVNQAPVLNNAIADQTIAANQSLNFTIPADTFFDPDPTDPLSYSLRISRDLIKNGSFEYGAVADDFSVIPLNVASTAIDQWIVTRDQIDYYDNEWVAADGDRSLDLNGSPGVGGIAQTIATEVGRTYTVTFDLAGHNSGLLQTLGIAAAGQRTTFDFQSSQDPNNLGWTRQSWQFTSTAPQTTLEFYSLQGGYAYGGPALDTVSIVVSDAPLPDWLTFDAATRTLSGTPQLGDIGTVEIEAIATDPNGESISNTFDLTITPSIAASSSILVTEITERQSSTDEDLTETANDKGLLETANESLLSATFESNTFEGSVFEGNVFESTAFQGKTNARTIGTQAKDRLPGTSQRDVLHGRRGNDSLFGKGGNDEIRGGYGRDRLHGGAGRDDLMGDRGGDILLGGNGKDRLWGGNDPNKDILNGGNGADTFLFRSLTGKADVIVDFQPGVDVIEIGAVTLEQNNQTHSGFDTFTQFIRLAQIGQNTIVRVDSNGLLDGGNIEIVVILRNTVIDTIQSTDFVWR